MKTVHELNQNELEELRSRLYHQYLDDGSLEEVIGENKTEEDIPMDFVKSHYEDTYFVEDDFFCNLEQDYTRDEILKITTNMKRFGGGFISALSEVINRADSKNLKKLQNTFSEEFEKYLNF